MTVAVQRRVGRTMTISGVVLALLTALITFGLVRSATKPPPPEPMTPVVYTADAVLSSTNLLTELAAQPKATDACQQASQKSAVVGSFQVCLVPTKYVPQAAMTLDIPVDQLGNVAVVRQALEKRLSNQIAVVDLKPGDMLLSTITDTYGGLSPNQRAVAIMVNKATSVGAAIRPGQHVDVVGSYEKDVNGKKVSTTEMLVQDVVVLAVTDIRQKPQVPSAPAQSGASNSQDTFTLDQQIQNDTTVTVAVNVEDAMRIAYVANFGKEVRLVTRRTDDKKVQPLSPVTNDSFK